MTYEFDPPLIWKHSNGDVWITHVALFSDRATITMHPDSPKKKGHHWFDPQNIKDIRSLIEARKTEEHRTRAQLETEARAYYTDEALF